MKVTGKKTSSTDLVFSPLKMEPHMMAHLKMTECWREKFHSRMLRWLLNNKRKSLPKLKEKSKQLKSHRKKQIQRLQQRTKKMAKQVQIMHREVSSTWKKRLKRILSKNWLTSLISWKLNKTLTNHSKRFKISCWDTIPSSKIGIESIPERLRHTSVKNLLLWHSDKFGDSWGIHIWFLPIRLSRSSIEFTIVALKIISLCSGQKIKLCLIKCMDSQVKQTSL